MTLALGCIAAVALSTLSVAAGARAALPFLLIAVVLACWAKAWRAPAAELSSTVCAGLIVCAGLLRGATVTAESTQIDERGWRGAELRRFEVVGASRPGPRCELELREPGAYPWSPSVRVSAPAQACPRAHGEEVAVLAQALRPSWASARRGDDRLDLGRGPVIWSRPTAPRSWPRIALAKYWRWIAQLRQRAWTSTRGDRSASLVVAVGLGLRSAIEPELRDKLRAAGLGHLIAVSGLHVAVAALWLQALARRFATLLGLEPRHACLLAWLPLWTYVGLTGGAASAVRAAAMLTAVELGVLVGRPSHGPTALAMVAAAMLLWRPSWLVDPGFALSLAAMTAIVTAPRAPAPGEDAVGPGRARLGVLAMSWRITWATAPLSVLFFDAAPLHGLLGNAVALPLFALMMPAALVACVATGPLGALALALARVPAAPILDLAELLARVPSVGAGGLLAAAVLGLALRRLVGEERPWLPPRLACSLAVVIAATLVISSACRSHAVRPRTYDWIALGTPRAASLLVADRADPEAACLYQPSGGLGTWERLLDDQGVRRLSALESKLPPAPGTDRPLGAMDPRTRALAAALRSVGVEVPNVEEDGEDGEDGEDEAAASPLDAGCVAPERARVRAALRACVDRQGGRGRALARSFAGAIECDLGDRWVRALELGLAPGPD